MVFKETLQREVRQTCEASWLLQLLEQTCGLPWLPAASLGPCLLLTCEPSALYVPWCADRWRLNILKSLCLGVYVGQILQRREFLKLQHFSDPCNWRYNVHNRTLQGLRTYTHPFRIRFKTSAVHSKVDLPWKSSNKYLQAQKPTVYSSINRGSHVWTRQGQGSRHQVS